MNRKVKKRLMFIAEEDFNLLSCIVIIVLDGLKCLDEKNSFKDIRKLALVAGMIGDEDVEYFFDFIDGKKKRERTAFVNLWARAQKLTPIFHRILYALERREIISTYLDDKKRVNVFLTDKKTAAPFRENSLFSLEYSNLDIMRSSIKGLSKVKYETMYEKVFGENEGMPCLA